MKKYSPFALLFSATIIISNLSSCKKQSCVTLKCGYVIVMDGNYGGQTVAQSPTECSTQEAWDKAISDFRASYSSSRYGIYFRESSTKENCTK